MEYPSYGTPPAGSIRFNTDSSKMEIYNGDKWWEIDSTSPTKQTGGTRGLFGTSNNENTNVITYANLSTTGDTIDFGDMTVSIGRRLTTSSRTRGCFAGGYPGGSNVIDYVTIDITGNAQDFGDLNSASRDTGASFSDGTRGVMTITNTPSGVYNVVEYITIASTGNALDFGDVSSGGIRQMGAGDKTRGIIFSGLGPGPAYDAVDHIDYVTISTKGNSSDFGNQKSVTVHGGSFCNAVRSLYAGGLGPSSPTITNNISYVTTSTLGNSIDFGDLGFLTRICGSASSPTRGVIAGGLNPSVLDTMEYFQIMTTGNAIDFGNLAIGGYGISGLSNGHGGLG